jgi:hypothetical protein
MRLAPLVVALVLAVGVGALARGEDVRASRRLRCGRCGKTVAVLPPDPLPGDAPPAPAAVADVTSLDPASLELSQKLVATAGTADANDVTLVSRRLAVAPPRVLWATQDRGIHVVACRDSVVEYLPQLKGVQPRGWPDGATWDSVPGVDWGKVVVIAVIGHATGTAHVPGYGEGEGSFALVLHELGHALDGAMDGTDTYSGRRDFLGARASDSGSLTPYESQAGAAGPQETWAEMFARFYGGDPGLAEQSPSLAALLVSLDAEIAKQEAKHVPPPETGISGALGSARGGP